MPSATPHEPRKLILCFDGTGNSFTGSTADTNVVKIFNKLDRQHPMQYHYYQTGVGTYDINETSVHKSWIGEMRSSMSKTIDQAIGTTFDAHVMAGYRFLMRYYGTGDKIYMFGFSRGAFTAKFLARMIHTVGLLCKGNEEMVPFAYRLYQRYLAGELQDFNDAVPVADKATDGDEECCETDPLINGEDGSDDHHSHMYSLARDEITAFSNTFCRKERSEVNGSIQEDNVKVYFLGIWDCVNSVAVLEREAPMPVPVKGTATYVRHAVAVDERRVKFKPALLAQDIRSSDQEQEDIKEVWFPGGHSDVGGGWPATPDDPLYNKPSKKPQSAWDNVKNLWPRFVNFLTTTKAKAPTKDIRKDPFQMSDIPLSWMIRELELVGEKNPACAVKWNNNVNGFKRAFQKNKDQAYGGFMHDSLRFGFGTGFFKVLMWKFMEWLPIITRWELEHNKWTRVRFPLNKGSTRDIPEDAVLHKSLVWRLENMPDYCPLNNHGGHLPPCLRHKGAMADVVCFEDGDKPDEDHRVYKLAK